MSHDSPYIPWLNAHRTQPDAGLIWGMRTASPVTLDFHAGQPLVKENSFLHRAQDATPLPTFAAARSLLPQPTWDARPDAIAAWWKAWELAFANLRPPRSRHHIANYIDTAFNDCLFLWDSVFILQFARYGARAFPFHRTLDNLYATQLADGFITRELRADGSFQFHPHDPASTGPNVLAWCEWQHFERTGDRDRLACVFPVILAYHRWLRLNRSWQDGSYFSCGLASGMDNLPRTPDGYERAVHHGHLSWIDATAQAALSADRLRRMAAVLGREADVVPEVAEHATLSAWIRDRAWDERMGFCYDVSRSGPIGVRHVGAYWAMLADLLTPAHNNRMAAHLEDPATFARHHRVPALAADHPAYVAKGGYWKGSVWPPTTWMVLKALERHGFDDLAHAIAVNHHERVLSVFKTTGTFWENYAPESDAPGDPSKGDFVGWGGLGPIAVLIEHRFGLRADVPRNTLVWDVRLTDAFGITQLPFGAEGLVDVQCAARASAEQRPDIRVHSTVPLTIDLRWAGGRVAIPVQAGKQQP